MKIPASSIPFNCDYCGGGMREIPEREIRFGDASNVTITSITDINLNHYDANEENLIQISCCKDCWPEFLKAAQHLRLQPRV